jgi:ethanolamine ammonia-lyase large subunit
MDAKSRLGHRGGSHDDHQADKTAAEKKKRSTITAKSFDPRVVDKMGGFFGAVFLPMMERLVEAGMSYDEVKRLVKIPGTWGATITGEQFAERTKKCLGPSGGSSH